MTAKFCLRCGRPLATVRDDRRWRRRCRACGWTFYDNPVPAVAAVIERRRRVLLTRRARPPYAGAWDLPGGFLETGETPHRGLRRELREELGIGVRGERLIGFANEHYGPRGFPVLVLAFRVVAGPGPIRPGDDVSEARWFARDRVPYARIAFPSLRRLLRRYLGRGG